MTGEFALWVYLSHTPLLWLTVTLLAYAVADRAFQAAGRHPLANPVIHAIWMIGLVLTLTGTPYRAYFEGAQFVHFLLGPATVALAVPLYERRATVMRALLPMLAAHGLGTARAFQVSEVAGTFAGIAMGLNAFLTAVLVPLVLAFLR